MPGSALLGDPPISDDDELIYNYFGGANSSSWTFLKEARTKSAPQHTQSSSIIIGNSFAIFFTLIITTARLWVRKYHLRAFGVDDVLIIPAAMGCVTFLSLQIVEVVVGGLGKRRLSWTYQEYAWSDQLSKIMGPVFFLAVFSAKISITLANRRITGITSKKWRIVHWVYLSFLVCATPILVLLQIFVCWPVPTYFSVKVLAKFPDSMAIHCLDRMALFLTARYTHMLTDLMLLPVPLIIIGRLRISFSRKIRLMLLFCVGLVDTVVCIVRNAFYQLEIVGIYPSGDVYGDHALDTVDIFFATLVASLPALNGVFDQAVKKVAGVGSDVGVKLISRFRSLGSTIWITQEHSAELPVQAMAKRSSRALNQDRSTVSLQQHDTPCLLQSADIECQSRPTSWQF